MVWIVLLILSLVVVIVSIIKRSPFFTGIGLFLFVYAVLKSLSLFIPPIPNFVFKWYILLTITAILLYFSIDEETFKGFKAPFISMLVEERKRFVRIPLFVIFPLVLAYTAYTYVAPKFSPPAESRTIHPEPPADFDFNGKRVRVIGLENPLRKHVPASIKQGDEANLSQYISEGKEIYYKNCVFCHGDLWDGKGIFAQGFNPTPLPFTGADTIAQLPEGYVFWRVATGWSGLPPASTPWSSAMPIWKDILSEDEIWKVILYIYDATGNKPRTWE